LERIGGKVPTSPDDKITKGIDGIYINKNPNSNIKYVIDEANLESRTECKDKRWKTNVRFLVNGVRSGIIEF